MCLRGLAFDLDGFILPDDEVAHLEVEGFLSPGVHCGSPIIADGPDYLNLFLEPVQLGGIGVV